VTNFTIHKLEEFAHSLQNEPLCTLIQQSAFSLKVVSNGFEITPASSNKARIITRKIIHQCWEFYKQSGSQLPKDYHSLTFDASYLLTIFKLYENWCASKVKSRFDIVAATLTLASEELQRLTHHLSKDTDKHAAKSVLTDLAWAIENCTVLGLHQIGEALDDHMLDAQPPIKPNPRNT